MMNIPNWTKYFLPLSLVITACAALFACKPGGETPSPVEPSVPFGAGSDLRAAVVREQSNCLYVADYSDHYEKKIRCIDLKTGTENSDAAIAVTGKPVAMIPGRDATTLIIALDNPPNVAIINLLAPEESRSCPVTGGIPRSLAVDANNRLYVGLDSNASEIQYCDITTATVTTPSSLFVSGRDRIAGMSHDGKIMFTASSDIKPGVTLWDLTPSPPKDYDQKELFGSTLSYGWIVFRPDDKEIFVVTNGTAADSSNLLSYAVSSNMSLTRTQTLRPGFLPNALAFLPKINRAVVTHGATRPDWVTTHPVTPPDIHIFAMPNGVTADHVEEELIELPTYVRDNGIVTDVNGVIYTLNINAAGTSSSVGIIAPP